MTLDADAARYLTTLRAAGVPPLGKLPLAEARTAYDESASRLFGPLDPIAEVEDLDADGVPVRVYRPASGELPALVYLHGGGWVLGSRTSHDPVCRALAARSGCAVVAVEYRLAPEHPHPAAIEDAWTAVRWASGRHPGIAVGGDSAGGQLAASVALRARDAGLRLALQLLIYPVTSFAAGPQAYPRSGYAENLTPQEMVWLWSQYVPDPESAGDPDCSPLQARDLAGVAPARVLTAGYDILCGEGEAYARRLEDAGVPVTLHRHDGLIHGFIRLAGVIGRASAALDEAAAAVAVALA